MNTSLSFLGPELQPEELELATGGIYIGPVYYIIARLILS